MSKVIMGIQLSHRNQSAPAFQKLLSAYGCSITTRIGLHQASAEFCSEQGLILLEFVDGGDKDAEKLEKALGEIDGIVVKTMVF